VSSPDPVIVSTLQTLKGCRRALDQAYGALSASTSVPDHADVAEAITLVPAVSEYLLKVHALLIGRALAN